MQVQTTNALSSNPLIAAFFMQMLGWLLLGWLVHPSDGAAVHDTKPHLGHWQLSGRVRLMRNCQVVTAEQP